MLTVLLGTALAASPIDGRWALATDRATVEAAQRVQADRALASVPEMFRPIGDRVLAPTFKVCGAYAIALTDTFYVRCDDGVPIQGPPDGVTRVVQVAGEPRPVSIRRDGDAIELTIHSDDGQRVTRYEPSPTGLRVRVTVTSSHLDVPISWDLQYRSGG